ncbi:hypothetical protein ACFL6U_24825 [Planctomycetota bacterium]
MKATILWKSAVAHTVTYFIFGVISYVLFDYKEKFSSIEYAGILRSLDHPLVAAGPMFQPIRGLLFGLVFIILGSRFFEDKRGWLKIWLILFIVGILNTFAATACSIEGMIYMPLPFWDHITGIPEILFQSLAFSYVAWLWIRCPSKRWLGTTLHILFFLTLALSLLGFIA